MPFNLLGFVILLWWAVGTLSQTLSSETTWPSSRFIGYYIAPDSTQALTAKTGTSWVTSATYAGDCVTTGRCPIATTCIGATVYFDDDTMLECTGNFACAHMTIFAASPNVLPSAHNYDCRQGWKAYTVYRELAAATTSSSSIATITSSPSSIATITSSPSPTTPSPTPSSTTLQTSATSSPKPTSSGKAWIAGGVVGPIVATALIVAVVVWWWRRSRKRKANSGGQEHGIGYEQDSPGYHPVQQELSDKERVVRPAEMPSGQQLAELPASGH